MCAKGGTEFVLCDCVVQAEEKGQLVASLEQKLAAAVAEAESLRSTMAASGEGKDGEISRLNGELRGAKTAAEEASHAVDLIVLWISRCGVLTGSVCCGSVLVLFCWSG